MKWKRVFFFSVQNGFSFQKKKAWEFFFYCFFLFGHFERAPFHFEFANVWFSTNLKETLKEIKQKGKIKSKRKMKNCFEFNKLFFIYFF